MGLLCIDMDDTLIDSDKSHILAFKKAFKKNKLKKVNSEQIKRCLGLSSRAIIKKLFPRIKKEVYERVLIDNENFFMKTKNHLSVFPGVKKTLSKLRKKYQLVLISNCTKKQVIGSLKEVKIRKGLFNLLVSCDDVKRPKPYPDEIVYAEKKLNKKILYVIGDSTYDIIAGKRAGAGTIAVLTGNHTKQQLEKQKPDFIFKNFNYVLRVL